MKQFARAQCSHSTLANQFSEKFLQGLEQYNDRVPYLQQLRQNPAAILAFLLASGSGGGGRPPAGPSGFLARPPASGFLLAPEPEPVLDLDTALTALLPANAHNTALSEIKEATIGAGS